MNTLTHAGVGPLNEADLAIAGGALPSLVGKLVDLVVIGTAQDVLRNWEEFVVEVQKHAAD